MAYYDISYSCGHTGRVQIVGPGKDRERKAAWYAQGICPGCYKAAAREAEKARGLVLTLYLMPYDLQTPVIAKFEGDTISCKEQIKAAGYQYDYAPAPGWLSALQREYRAWWTAIKIEDIDDTISKARAIGATTINNEINAIDIAAYYKLRDDRMAELNKEMAELGPRPAWPDCMPKGRWNCKIYGRAGNYSVYVDGNKIELTDDQAAEIETWNKADDAWLDAKNKIYKKYDYRG